MFYALAESKLEEEIKAKGKTPEEETVDDEEDEEEVRGGALFVEFLREKDLKVCLMKWYDCPDLR
jgi:hypothetical protein